VDRANLEKGYDIPDVRQILDPHNRKAGPSEEVFGCTAADTAKAVDANSNVLPVAQIPLLLSSGSIRAFFRPPGLATPPCPAGAWASAKFKETHIRPTTRSSIHVTLDNLVKSQQNDGFVKSSRCKAHKN